MQRWAFTCAVLNSAGSKSGVANLPIGGSLSAYILMYIVLCLRMELYVLSAVYAADTKVGTLLRHY